jgi:hypothetical protein
MRTRLAFGAGLAVGYILGARAGRERYEQIARAARSFRNNPTVQEKFGAAQEQASALISSAQQTVAEKVGDRPLPGPVSKLIGQDRTSSTHSTDAGSGPLTDESASPVHDSGVNGLGRA